MVTLVTSIPGTFTPDYAETKPHSTRRGSAVLIAEATYAQGIKTMANLETQTVDRVGDLAATLVDELGVDDAVTVCMNNHW